jgi:hypothetical protein
MLKGFKSEDGYRSDIVSLYALLSDLEVVLCDLDNSWVNGCTDAFYTTSRGFNIDVASLWLEYLAVGNRF